MKYISCSKGASVLSAFCLFSLHFIYRHDICCWGRAIAYIFLILLAIHVIIKRLIHFLTFSARRCGSTHSTTCCWPSRSSTCSSSSAPSPPTPSPPSVSSTSGRGSSNRTGKKENGRPWKGSVVSVHFTYDVYQRSDVQQLFKSVGHICPLTSCCTIPPNSPY